MHYQKFSLAFGFFVWLVATLVFSFWGHTFFPVAAGLMLFAFYLLVVPVLYFLVNWVFQQFALSDNEKIRSALLMALPGMFLDVLCIRSHAWVFPGFTTDQVIGLGSWVLWVYGIVLLLGFLLKDRKAANT